MSVHKASEWWRTDRYVRKIRFRRVFGIPIPYRESVYGNYFTKRRQTSENVVRVIKELQEAGQIMKLGHDSRVLEPGCNVGSNLYHLHKAFGCQMYGFDISEEAINIAKERVLNYNPPPTLWVDDFLRPDLFDRFRAEEFDLVLTVGFLMHIPICEAKVHQITRLMQIAKSLVVFELFDVEKTGQSIHYHDGAYCLAYDDYSQYGLTEYSDQYFNDEHCRSKVFYHFQARRWIHEPLGNNAFRIRGRLADKQGSVRT